MYGGDTERPRDVFVIPTLLDGDSSCSGKVNEESETKGARARYIQI